MSRRHTTKGKVAVDVNVFPPYKRIIQEKGYSVKDIGKTLYAESSDGLISLQKQAKVLVTQDKTACEENVLGGFKGYVLLDQPSRYQADRWTQYVGEVLETHTCDDYIGYITHIDPHKQKTFQRKMKA